MSGVTISVEEVRAATGPDYKVYENYRLSLVEQQDRYLAAEAEKTRAAGRADQEKPRTRRAKRLKPAPELGLDAGGGWIVTPPHERRHKPPETQH